MRNILLIREKRKLPPLSARGLQPLPSITLYVSAPPSLPLTAAAASGQRCTYVTEGSRRDTKRLREEEERKREGEWLTTEAPTLFTSPYINHTVFFTSLNFFHLLLLMPRPVKLLFNCPRSAQLLEMRSGNPHLSFKAEPLDSFCLFFFFLFFSSIVVSTTTNGLGDPVSKATLCNNTLTVTLTHCRSYAHSEPGSRTSAQGRVSCEVSTATAADPDSRTGTE